MAVSGAPEAEVARSTYDAARDHFDAAPLRFWDRYGQRTVTRANLSAGARVLDVCSGTGASALAAAKVVGAAGRVTAVDISPALLSVAEKKASCAGLANVDFRVSDMAQLDFERGSFDAVFVVFGIFFATDIVAQIRSLARLLRPRGTLAITTWGPGLFEPLYAPFLDDVRRHRPGFDEYRPWDRVTSADEMSALMHEAGVAHADITAESGAEVLQSAADWWSIVLGTGLRWFVDQLDEESAAAVHAASLERARAVRAVATNVIYTVARV